MKNERAFFGGHFGGHRRFPNLLELEVAIEAFLIEGECFAALAIEIQVGIQLCHGVISLRSKARRLLTGRGCILPSIQGVVYDKEWAYL